MTEPSRSFELQCPVPLPGGNAIQMAHGGGGTLTNDLIDRVFRKAFSSDDPALRHDSSVLDIPGVLAFTTDSYVIKPIFFPGGDIGSLAVTGTVNDLAMSGARPVALSAAFILEEGLPIDVLERLAASMRQAADQAGVRIVTGDTKVVDRGKGDQVFITTAGVGRIQHPWTIRPSSVKQGDVVILSGDLGRHGTSILAVREGLAFETPIVSDCAPLWPAVEALLASGVEIHCLRDLTRGGLCSAVNEIARDSQTNLLLEEGSIAVPGPVKAACELLGLDPLTVANEGRFAAYVPGAQAERALSALRQVEVSRAAAPVGRVESLPPGERPRVRLKTSLGAERFLDMLTGEPLPRIC